MIKLEQFNKNIEFDVDIVREEAADWVILLQDEQLDIDVRKKFKNWLSRSEVHVKIWQETQKTWGILGQMSAEYSTNIEQVKSPDNKLIKPHKSFFKNKKSLTSTIISFATAACFIFMMWPALLLFIHADMSTSAGEVKEVVLEDGSRITLGADSAIKTVFTLNTRKVELLRGQAFFQVTRDISRPFTVESVNSLVTVLGTEFDVETTDEIDWIGVASGTVEVSSQDKQAILTAGKVLTVDHNANNMVVQTTSVQNIASWREGRIFVRNRKVKDVVGALDRYFDGSIFMLNGNLSDKTITGSLQLDNVKLALEALVQPHGGKVVEITSNVFVIISA